ncbi:hypothetical protein [Fibrella forsythiae]|uniref:Terminase-like family protein n=1 Tax=Fibrella forsythiae TaxID=2817061 RepID=A0ABS3JM28_9BACT|nr:hypothetical protein [Fibrella forsythiae]MBO0951067.1 hypothetical protein [Fibrella forsythiae]
MTVVRNVPGVDEARDIRQGHMNSAQLMARLVNPQNFTGIIGRGGGKSDGILAPHLHDCVKQMPRGSFVLLGVSYIQILTRTLPAILNGLHRLGYERDRNYWVGRYPERSLGLKLPYFSPLDPKYSMFIRDGDELSVVPLVGQDRPGSANGLSVDAVLGDEVKFINKRKLDEEVRPIKRGNRQRYGHCHLLHGEWFTTDMPTGKEAKWIFEAEAQANLPHNRQAVELILALEQAIYDDRQRLRKGPNSSATARIIEHQALLGELRRELTYYHEASSFVNIDVLGMAYFREQRRDLPPARFNAQILSKRDQGAEGGFYPSFDRDLHCYDAIDYGYVDNQEFGALFNDCRKDVDDDPTQDLTIAGDYGASFNCLWVGQRLSRFISRNKTGRDEVRYLNHFYLPHPQETVDVVQKFCDYYKYRLRKRVEYVFDLTAVGTSGLGKNTYASVVIDTLRKNGWTVIERYIGKVPAHNERYLAWGKALREQTSGVPLQRFNRENTMVGTSAMLGAGTKQGRNGFEKDKTDERNQAIDQHLTTHLTDAADTLFWWLTVLVGGTGDISGVLTST